MKKLFTVLMTVSQPVFAESEEDAIRIAKCDSYFDENREFEAKEMSIDYGIPTYLRGCLVFHDGDDDITIEEAFAMQGKEGVE